MPVRKSSRAKDREKLGRALSDHVVADFLDCGAEAVAKLRQQKPLDYLKLVQQILAKEDADEQASKPGYLRVERIIIRPENPDS
jgi:hypothetical protein